MPLQNVGAPVTGMNSLAGGFRNFATMMAVNKQTKNDAASARLNDAKTLAQEFKNKTRREGFDRTMAMMPQQGTQVNADANGVMTAGDTPWTPDQQMQRQDIGNLAQMYAEGATNTSPQTLSPQGQMYSNLSGDIRGLTSDQEAAQSLSGMAGLEAKNMAEGKTTAMQNIEFINDPNTPPEQAKAMTDYMAKSGVTVNTGSQMKVPSGYMIDPEDPTGGSIVQIPGKGFTPEQSAKVAALANASSHIPEARKMLFDDDGNLDRGLLASMDIGIQMGTSGIPGTDGRELFIRLYEAAEAKIRAESGAAVQESEIKRLSLRAIPSSVDTAEQVRIKLKTLEDFINGTLDGVYAGKVPDWVSKATPAEASTTGDEQPQVMYRRGESGLVEKSVDGGSTWQ